MTSDSETSIENEYSDSEIREFFKNQSIFLTGATGFLGKVILEKLLQTTDVKMVYILIRKKRDKDIKERVADIFQDPLFQVLHRERRDFLMRVHPIVGDCSLPHLGITKVDQQLLKENVSVVIHSAATVRFIEPLKNALEINVRATLALIELAKEMVNMKSFLHVSSAFANCNRPHIDEVFYSAGISGENACLLAELLSPEVLDKISSKLIGNFPNTYTYTKALAEEIILMNGKELPLCVFRPGIVIPTYKDPVPGWIDNLYGPTSILIGAATGVLRVLYARMTQNAAVVPVDYCANAILACSWHTAKNHATIPPIYNFVPDPENLVQWEAYRVSALTDGVKMPFTRMLWYPTLTVTASKTWFSILCFFYHIVPAIIFDFCLIMVGRKRRMLKMYKKIHKSCSLLNYFAENDWTFTCDNIKKIWAKLPETDHELYPFDMRQIVWSRQFYHSMCGVRRYLAKEEPKTIPKGIKLLRRLRILHSAMLLTVYGSGICLLLMFVFKVFFDK